METSDAPSGADAIRAAALSIFFERGYHGTSVREIARRAGLSVAALYHHFPSKYAILLELVNGFTRDLLEEVTAASQGDADDNAARLAAVVRAHVLFHIRRRTEAWITYADRRGLDPDDRAAFAAQREAERQLVEHFIREGIAREEFSVHRVEDSSRALLQMSSAVFSWYRDDGPLTPDQIADSYAVLALDMVQSR